MIIRKYQPKDRSRVEYIHFETFLIGKSIRPFVNDQKRFDEEIKYYLDKEPESCFVVEDKSKVVGYLLGCLDDKKNDEGTVKYFLKHLIILFQLPFMSSKDIKFCWSRIKYIIYAIFQNSDEKNFKVPKDSSHLHINLLPKARGSGVGTKLLKAFFKYAKSKGVKTIHADSWQTRLNPNKNFWIKNGFKEYCKVKTKFWNTYYPNEDIGLVCYIKKL